MLLAEILNEAITIKRLEDTRSNDDQPSDAEVVSPEESTDDELDFDINSDEEYPDNTGAGGMPEEEAGGDDIANPISDGNQLSFSSFMQNSNSPLGSASISTPRPGENGADNDDTTNDGEDTNTEGDLNGPDNAAASQLINAASEDPSKQGVLRTVKNARLVYKRKGADGSYEELWAYNTGSGNITDELNHRQAILAGTDIPPAKLTSPDGQQSYEVWTTSNAEMMIIRGLPN